MVDLGQLVNKFMEGYCDQQNWVQHVLATENRLYESLLSFRKRTPPTPKRAYQLGSKAYNFLHRNDSTVAMCIIAQAALEHLQQSGVERYDQIPEDVRTDLLDALDRNLT